MADVDDDPKGGEEVYVDVDMDRDFSLFSHKGVYKDVAAKTAIMAQKAGVTKEELQQELADAFRKRRIVNTVVDKGRNGENLTDYQVELIFQALTPEQQAELKQELLDSLPWNYVDADGNVQEGDKLKQAAFVDYLFRTGAARRVTLEDLLRQYGIAGDQSGKTGAGTQSGDTALYCVLCGLSDFYRVAQDECAQLWRIKHMQSPDKACKDRNLEPRRYARHLACAIAQELYDEVVGERDGKRVVIPQTTIEDCRLYDEHGRRAEGRKIKSSEWNDVQKKIGQLLSLAYLELPREEGRELTRALRARVDEWNGVGTERGQRQARKLKTYLTDRQLAEL